ncbi:MAG TPA: hypothetical protein DEP35_06735 [Deltaproteobacteria bacterium]|nr:hypothetical protein [Deltaproteobacteria bacterium]
MVVDDDGVRATMRAALRGVRHPEPRQLISGVPVAPPEAVDVLRSKVDEGVCLATPEYLEAIGSFYLDFHQVGDEEVRELPDRAAPLQKHPNARDAT